MQLNSLYTTHDMRLSNILQQYDYTTEPRRDMKKVTRYNPFKQIVTCLNKL